MQSVLRRDGGEEETRTPDPGVANAVLSHLSYFPTMGGLGSGGPGGGDAPRGAAVPPELPITTMPRPNVKKDFSRREFALEVL